METTINFWIEHSNSFMHQIFMIVMGMLYAMSFILGISYKAVNIFIYFVVFPFSFLLFFKGKWKYFLLPAPLLFFAIPNYEKLSSKFFDDCVVFLNYTAKIFDSNYINMSVYLCVLVPLLLYIPFIIYRFTKKQLYITFAIFSAITLLYGIFVYPFFKPLLISLSHYIS